MTNINEIHKCKHCGIMTETVHAGGGKLICCGENMQRIDAGTTDAAVEKHVPAIEKSSGVFNVTVGSVAHPMTDDHYIEWVELVDGDNVVYRQNLKPGQEPMAKYNYEGSNVKCRAYCNLHGLWEKEA